MNVRFPANEITAANDPCCRPSDHSRVVGAVREGGKSDRYIRPATVSNFLTQTLSKQRIRTDSAGENDRSNPEFKSSSRGLDREWLDDSLLECGGEVINW